MKKFFLFLAAAVLALAFAACTTTGAPNATQVQAMQQACAIDAGVRPSVTVLLSIPGLATVQEVAAVAAARAVIDPICANPAGSAQANSLAVLSSATGQVTSILIQLQARKAGSVPAPVAAASS